MRPVSLFRQNRFYKKGLGRTGDRGGDEYDFWTVYSPFVYLRGEGRALRRGRGRVQSWKPHWLWLRRRVRAAIACRHAGVRPGSLLTERDSNADTIHARRLNRCHDGTLLLPTPPPDARRQKRLLPG